MMMMMVTITSHQSNLMTGCIAPVQESFKYMQLDIISLSTICASLLYEHAILEMCGHWLKRQA